MCDILRSIERLPCMESAQGRVSRRRPWRGRAGSTVKQSVISATRTPVLTQTDLWGRLISQRVSVPHIEPLVPTWGSMPAPAPFLLTSRPRPLSKPESRPRWASSVPPQREPTFNLVATTRHSWFAHQGCTWYPCSFLTPASGNWISVGGCCLYVF